MKTTFKIEPMYQSFISKYSLIKYNFSRYYKYKYKWQNRGQKNYDIVKMKLFLIK